MDTETQYKHGYNRLYGFLRNKHPEILKEYQALMKQAKDDAVSNYNLACNCVDNSRSDQK